MGREPTRAWTSYDSALWHTCRILSALERRDAHHLPEVDVPFAPQIAPGREVFLAADRFRLEGWEAPGDGSYVHHSGMFLSSGRGALTTMAGFAAGQAAGNARRRRRAQLDAVPRWMTVGDGLLYVGSHGFYLHTVDLFAPWDWASVDMVNLVHHGVVQIHGHGDRGATTFRLVSDWAELLFVLWALARNPRHPQLPSGGWLPPRWVEWAAEQGYPPEGDLGTG